MQLKPRWAWDPRYNLPEPTVAAFIVWPIGLAVWLFFSAGYYGARWVREFSERKKKPPIRRDDLPHDV